MQVLVLQVWGGAAIPHSSKFWGCAAAATADLIRGQVMIVQYYLLGIYVCVSYSALGHVLGLFSLTKGQGVHFKKIALYNLLVLSPIFLKVIVLYIA